MGFRKLKGSWLITCENEKMDGMVKGLRRVEKVEMS